MNTDLHALALFLHPLCRRLAIHQAAKGRSFEHYATVATGLAQQWKWNKDWALRLIEDLKLYHAGKAPFAGNPRNALEWWESLPISGQDHPLKILAITLFSIVPHAAEVERLFSNLGGIQGVRRSNLTVPTFETLAKLRSHYASQLWHKRRSEGKSIHRKHKHMHTRAEPGIDADVTLRLDREFTWTPPLTLPMDSAEDAELLNEEYTMDEFEKDWAEYAEQAKQATSAIDPQVEGEVVNAAVEYDMQELQRIDQRLGPSAFVDDVSIHVRSNGGDEEWDILEILCSQGVSNP